MKMEYKDIKKAITKSQHCQRNWNLSKVIPFEDIELFKYAVTQCPSKQNIAYYDIYFIADRKKIEDIHDCTTGFYIDGKHRTNSQVLANLLIAFVEKDYTDIIKTTQIENFHRNAQIEEIKTNNAINNSIERDKHMAIGIAAGYLNLTANMLGYQTGCCACFDNDRITKILNSNSVSLLMGVGFKDEKRARREHHNDSKIIFPSLKKQEINTIFI